MKMGLGELERALHLKRAFNTLDNSKITQVSFLTTKGRKCSN